MLRQKLFLLIKGRFTKQQYCLGRDNNIEHSLIILCSDKALYVTAICQVHLCYPEIHKAPVKLMKTAGMKCVHNFIKVVWLVESGHSQFCTKFSSLGTC